VSQATLVCANHPNRETLLRCNRCEKPICSKCAVLTPVGYRCRECVRGVRAGFDNVEPWDYPLAALVSAAGAGVATWLLGFLSWWGLFAAPVAGGLMAEGVRLAVRRRRGQRLALAAAAGGAAGALMAAGLPLLAFLPLLAAGAQAPLLSLAAGGIWPLINGALLVSTLFYRLRGIQL
jgi:hypothetical protein